MRKFTMLLALMGLAAFSLAGTASASSNLPNGTTITGTSSSVALGSFISCTSSVSGPITNGAAGQGATGTITAASFDNCSPSGASTTVTGLPWPITMNTNAGGGTWTGSVGSAARPIIVDVTVGPLNCRYSGTISLDYSNTSMIATLAGSLAGTGFLCPTPSAVIGNYTILPTLTLS